MPSLILHRIYFILISHRNHFLFDRTCIKRMNPFFVSMCVSFVLAVVVTVQSAGSRIIIFLIIKFPFFMSIQYNAGSGQNGIHSKAINNKYGAVKGKLENNRSEKSHMQAGRRVGTHIPDLQQSSYNNKNNNSNANPNSKHKNKTC